VRDGTIVCGNDFVSEIPTYLSNDTWLFLLMTAAPGFPLFDHYDTRVNSILIRTSHPLSEQQVAQFKQSGAINETAKTFRMAPAK
jgi:hypothetical protein